MLKIIFFVNFNEKNKIKSYTCNVNFNVSSKLIIKKWYSSRNKIVPGQKWPHKN